MIKSFAHKGIERFFLKASKAGINPQHAARLGGQLARLNVSTAPQDMNVPGWDLHELKGDRAGCWSVSVSGHWRLTFRFEGTDAILADYEDYH